MSSTRDLNPPGPTDREIVVISGRRLIADVLCAYLRDQPGVRRCYVHQDLGGASQAENETSSTFLIDLDDPAMPVEAVVEVLRGGHTGSRRLGFYDTFTARHAQRAFELKLSALLPLSAPVDQIARSVMAENTPSSVTKAEGLTRDQLTRLSTLTQRELQVLEQIARGRPVKLIASLLGITPHTVETHKRRAFRKLGVQHQSHAIALATDAGMLTAP